MNKNKKILLSLSGVIFIAFLVFIVPVYIPIQKNCCEYGLLRWKFAVYYVDGWEGEGGGGSYREKMEGSGWREYFGLKEIKCPCE